jgi:hypothetical protein
MNIDDRLRAASQALEDGSVAQVDAASRLREIVLHTDQLVAHARVPVLPDRRTSRCAAPSPPFLHKRRYVVDLDAWPRSSTSCWSSASASCSLSA